jgi:anthranilate phosphoribosyltransferase
MIDPIAALERVIAGDSLSRDEMESLIGRLMDGELEEPVQAGLLVALAAKGESATEIAGAAIAMRSRVIAIPHRRADVVDTCGTGGDGKGTFNVSTAAALIAAAAGVPVAKHGNRSVSSRSGSADVLEALGVPIETDAEGAGRSLDEVGLAFLFAPRLHPAVRAVMPVRRALGVRTLFNVLGPLTNPAGAQRQLLGVYAPRLVGLLADVLLELGSVHALVVHGSDGLDEITTTGATEIAEVRAGAVHRWVLTPEECGLPRASAADLIGGDPAANAASMSAVLAGAPGPLLDISLLNAGAAIYVAGLAPAIGDGVGRAREAVETGAAVDKLEELRRPPAGE